MTILPKANTDAVVSIGIRIEAKKISWVGTGFFLMRRVDERHALPFLVTNKHVLKDLENIVIRMKGENGLIEQEIQVAGEKNGPFYHVHDNPEIDIAVLPFDGALIGEKHLEFRAFDVDNCAMTSEELLASETGTGLLVYMLGFPMGLVNVTSNAPICRLGCIARLDSAQIQETNNILLDIQNFPGNSGSPVVSRPEPLVVDSTPRPLRKSMLIGIVHSYIPYEKQLKDVQTGKIVEIQSENSGIANMHPVEYIREIIDKIQPRVQP